MFQVPMQNVHVRFPPLQVGEVVTFSYEHLTRRDVPVHAEIFRRRSELKWEDVIANSRSQQHIQGLSPLSPLFPSPSLSGEEWVEMRGCGCDFAISAYSSSLLALPSLHLSLLHLYPPSFSSLSCSHSLSHLTLYLVSESHSKNFTTKPRGFWTFDNMRAYITNFAKNLNLDPLLPATWHKISNSIFDTKVFYGFFIYLFF
jgi:hypothetical protein